MTSPQTALIVAEKRSHSVSADFRPVIICGTVAVRADHIPISVAFIGRWCRWFGHLVADMVAAVVSGLGTVAASAEDFPSLAISEAKLRLETPLFSLK
jgi:hypothetical protein